jgi:glycosyltransferase involved in cell wall biosynthesis
VIFEVLYKLKERPKILLVTETPPGTANGFGVTLQTMFKDLSPTVVFTDASFKKYGGQKGYVLAQVPYHRSKRFLFNYLLGKIPEWRGNFSRLWLRKNLKEKFDMVYSFVYSSNCLEYGWWLSKMLKCKHVSHIADHSDDFTENAKWKRIISDSDGCVTIGKNMKDEYEKVYSNLSFEIIHNGIDCKDLPFEPHRYGEFSEKMPLKVLFLGSLFKHLHLDGIQDICRAVKELYSDGHPIHFDLYGQREPRNVIDDFLGTENIRHKGKINPENRFELMREYHCLAVPSTFEPDLAKAYSYSIPTKLTEVLSSGRPVLVYGPEVMESFRFCNENASGKTITIRSVKKIKDYFLDLIEGYRERENESCKSASRVIGDHSGDIVRNKLMDFLHRV